MYETKLACSICGGEVIVGEDGTLGTCMGCGNSLPYPKTDIKKHNRVTYLRNNYDFEKAGAIAAALIEDNSEDCTAYIEAFLCDYGIRYIRNGSERTPVCSVAADSNVKENSNYKKAVYYAPAEEQQKYEVIAAAVEGAVEAYNNAISAEEPYDIFVLTREGVSVDDDLEGEKLFLRFTENLGFRVFYAPEMLKDKSPAEKAAITAYALENSRIMLPIFKTESDCVDGYMNYAVNKFSLEAANNEEKSVFPIFNAGVLNFQQLPEALVWSDIAFDYSDSEFMREISEKVEGILKPEEAAVVPDAIVTATAANKENLIKRAYMFLEDGEYETADTYFDKILDIDIEDSRAYIGKLLASCKLKSEDEIPNLPQTVTDDKNFIKALRFATPEQKARYEALNGAIVERIESEKKRIAEEHQRLKAEREELENIERERRARQQKEERKLEYQRRCDPLRKTLREIQAELNKTFITPKRKAELKEQEETVKRNIKSLEMIFPDIWD